MADPSATPPPAAGVASLMPPPVNKRRSSLMVSLPEFQTLRVPVYLMNGDKIELDLPRLASADDFRVAVCKMLRLDVEQANLFCMWGISGVANLLSLELPGNVAPLDLEPEWTRLLKYFCEKKKRRKTPDWYECRITFRSRAMLPVQVLRNVDDPGAVRLLFHEATHAVLETKYFNLALEKQVKLAALHLQVLDSSFNKKTHKKETLAPRVKTLFSRNTLRLVNRLDLAEMLIPAYKKLKDTTAMEAMMAYLDLMYEEPLFTASFFETIVKDSPFFRENEYCILALHSRALYFCRAPSNSDDSMAVVLSVPYEDVMCWDYEETSFTIGILVNEVVVMQRTYTKKGTLIIDLLQRGTAIAHASVVGVPPPQGLL